MWIRTEMGGGGGGRTISLNIGPISLGIWGLVEGPISPMIWSHVTREMGRGGGGGGGGPFHYYIVQSYLKSISLSSIDNLIVVARQLKLLAS